MNKLIFILIGCLVLSSFIFLVDFPKDEPINPPHSIKDVLEAGIINKDVEGSLSYIEKPKPEEVGKVISGGFEFGE